MRGRDDCASKPWTAGCGTKGLAVSGSRCGWRPKLGGHVGKVMGMNILWFGHHPTQPHVVVTDPPSSRCAGDDRGGDGA